jgi:hypothetical protein
MIEKKKKGPRQRRKDNKSLPPLLLIVKRLKRPKQNRETCKEIQPMRRRKRRDE